MGVCVCVWVGVCVSICVRAYVWVCACVCMCTSVWDCMSAHTASDTHLEPLQRDW